MSTSEYYWKNREKLLEKKKLYREKNKESISAKRKKYNKEKLLTTKESSPEKWLEFCLLNCKTRHKTKPSQSHITCTVTIEDLIQKYKEQKGLCAISKVRLEHKQGSMNSISIDRIDNNLGYTKENIHLTTKWINIGRRNATIDQLKQAIQDILNANENCP